MPRMPEYIAIEDDNVMSHFLQVLVIGMEDCMTAFIMFIGNSDEWVYLVIKHDTLKLHLKVWVITAGYEYFVW